MLNVLCRGSGKCLGGGGVRCVLCRGNEMRQMLNVGAVRCGNMFYVGEARCGKVVYGGSEMW